jgi:elongator complex protein 3
MNESDSRKIAARKAAAKARHVSSEKEFHELKKLPGKGMLSHSEIIAAAREAGIEIDEKMKRKRTRTASGVCVIAIMTAPLPCPGKCIYCPGGVEKGSAKSYTGFEPAALRAKSNDFDAFLQVKNRLEQLEAIGHSTEKCELIVMGGTFNFLPTEYQTTFVKRALEAFNEKTSLDLKEAMKANESAKHRVIGITFETRPDWVNDGKKVKELLALGATRIELGVQTLSNKVYKKIKRGHGVKEVVEATKACKDAFLKVCYHYMPGLFVQKNEDVHMFKQLFSDPRFRPDALKIYPCLVLEGTELHELWRKKKFAPYDTEEATEVIAEMKKFVPEYCRIMRVDRDIPTNLVVAGVKKSNLRELVRERMRENSAECRCIRCREAGFKNAGVDLGAVKLHRMDYEASGGKEVFLSFVDDEANDVLVAYLRLRKPLRGGVAGVRELRVCGQALPLHARKKGEAQHKGFGRMLLEEAERIGVEWNVEKISVLSGIGVKPYYRALGYADEGFYLSKKLL